MAQSVELFGQWVRDRRKQRHLTQKSLGRLIGYAEVTIRQIEHDKYHLTRFVVDGIVNCLAGEQDDREAIVRFALQQFSTIDDAGLSVGSRPSLTPFLGRAAELAEIRALLHNPDCRCISIVGVGGIGKTRLAMRAVGAFVSETAAMACFLNLANVTTAALLPSAVAAALDIAITPFASPFEQVLLAIRSKDMLLVFDNFEHLLPDGIAFVLAILERAPQIKVVVTSRERLRISAEWCIPLQGLDTAEQPSLSEAARLFVSTAQRINNKFDAAETDAIQDICRVVRGIPLAIEMAASWTEVYSCREILADISIHALGLASRQRDIDDRHRTLQAVFETTWMLLSPVEQAMLKKLAVFRGGFTLDAAKKVAGVTHAILAFLQDKMLIWPQNNGRLVMHEMVHQFAFQKLVVDEDELRQARLSHAEYFVELLRQSLPRLKYHYSRQEIARLVPENENLEIAWETILQQGRADWFLYGWEALFLFYNITSRFQHGEVAFRLASTTFRSAYGETERYIRAFSQAQHAAILFRQGRIPEARSVLFAPETQVVRDTTRFGQCWIHMFDAFVYHGMGNGPAALKSAQLSVDVAGDDQYLNAATLFILGRVERFMKDNANATQHLYESFTLCQQYGLSWGMGLVLTELGFIAEEEQSPVEALNYYERLLADSASFEDLWTYHHTQICIGRVQLALGQFEKAVDTQLTVLRAMMRNPVIGLQIDNFVEVAQILAHDGQPQLAVALLEVCASHPETGQPTRDRAAQYLTGLKTRLPDRDVNAARHLLPASKSEIAALLLNCLNAGGNI